MVTHQEAFNRVATALLKQRVSSLGSNGRCKYRGPAGLKCAIGHLLSDENYRPEFEDYVVINLVQYYAPPELAGCAFGFLQELQLAHDTFLVGSDKPEEAILSGLSAWRARMVGIAIKWNLDPSAVN